KKPCKDGGMSNFNKWNYVHILITLNTENVPRIYHRFPSLEANGQYGHSRMPSANDIYWSYFEEKRLQNENIIRIFASAKDY
ncbi:MAG: hypothetical protein K2N25_05715, partial [Muribaculaceae bacterium]|nr:hypothetical protein [Muribaculaceae bacterium]